MDRMRAARLGMAIVALTAAPALAAAEVDTTAVAADSAAAPVPAPATPPPPAFDVRPGAVPNAPIQAVRHVRLTGSDHIVLRSGPGETFAVVGVFREGQSFPVLAKRGDWYDVRISDSATGWVHAALCREFDDLSDLEFTPNPRLYTRTGTYVLGAYGGAYAFDRKSNSLVLGGRLGYYVFDRVITEAGVGWTYVERPAEIVESLFGLSLEAEEFHMLFYHLDLTYELLPGRQMVPFVNVGVGSSILRGDSEAAWHFGAGTKLFLSRRTAVRWEVRDYRFASGSDEARVTNDNIEFSLGTEILF